MDGVNGVTQCPIAPNDYFVYKFKATQYGSSWYHSHYSVQYADGAVGPMTLHGPSSADFDEAVSPPLIMTDWGHNSAFAALYENLKYPDVLLNGRGNVTAFNNSVASITKVERPWNMTFEKTQEGQPCKRYLLRVINTSFFTTFVLSIDNHWLQIASADFVPIVPYKNTSVLVGIGQRYNVIVEAKPVMYNKTNELPKDGNYWIRTYTAKCGSPALGVSDGYEKTGILYYNNKTDAYPTSERWQNVSLDCSDETYGDLHPILPWQVKDPINGKNGQSFDFWNGPPQGTPKTYPLSEWTLTNETEGFVPLRVNYSKPTFLRLDQKDAWDPELRMVSENYTSQDWVGFALHAPIVSSS